VVNKLLTLTLKKKWFDMILAGIKKEEYREIKPYWTKRLFNIPRAILFTNGYGKKVPSILIECKGLYRSLGIIEWGAPEKIAVYILKLGEIIETKNIKGSAKC